tara:strand:+ start:52 stop:216 length:165 start_codon:yes stop_codon:yes gene_type:complete
MKKTIQELQIILAEARREEAAADAAYCIARDALSDAGDASYAALLAYDQAKSAV